MLAAIERSERLLGCHGLAPWSFTFAAKCPVRQRIARNVKNACALADIALLSYNDRHNAGALQNFSEVSLRSSQYCLKPSVWVLARGEIDCQPVTEWPKL